MLLTIKMLFATLTQEQRFKLLNQFALTLKFVECAIVVTRSLTVAMVTFQNIFAVVLTVVLITIAIMKEHFVLHSVFSQLFNLNATFKCSYQHMTSVYLQKNVHVKQKTLAIFLEKYLSLWMNFSHQTNERIIAVQSKFHTLKTLAVAINKFKMPYASKRNIRHSYFFR
jgi:general stress protein CsbA